MVNWQSIETVLLDLDGTLLDLHFDNYFWIDYLPARYAEIHDVDEDFARTHLDQRLAKERGTLNWYCVDYWSRELNLDIARLKKEVTDRITFLPYAQAFLAQLRDHQLRPIVVTNAHRKVLDLKEDKLQLSAWVDEIWSAHDFGYAKEHAIFWESFAAKHAFDPKTTLFIDDNEAVLDAASAFGINHLIFPLQPDTRQSIRQHPASSNYLPIHSLQQLLVD